MALALRNLTLRFTTTYKRSTRGLQLSPRAPPGGITAAREPSRCAERATRRLVAQTALGTPIA